LSAIVFLWKEIKIIPQQIEKEKDYSMELHSPFEKAHTSFQHQESSCPAKVLYTDLPLPIGWQ
jgi:hypothetical protein